MIIVKCTKCSGRVRTPNKDIGKVFKCNFCDNKMRLVVKKVEKKVEQKVEKKVVKEKDKINYTLLFIIILIILFL
jgi:hypothetical protein